MATTSRTRRLLLTLGVAAAVAVPVGGASLTTGSANVAGPSVSSEDVVAQTGAGRIGKTSGSARCKPNLINAIVRGGSC